MDARLRQVNTAANDLIQARRAAISPECARIIEQVRARCPDAFVGREVAVIGYPALDDRNDIDLQMRIFRRLFRVKRLQPGKATGTAQVADAFGNNSTTFAAI